MSSDEENELNIDCDTSELYGDLDNVDELALFATLSSRGCKVLKSTSIEPQRNEEEKIKPKAAPNNQDSIKIASSQNSPVIPSLAEGITSNGFQKRPRKRRFDSSPTQLFTGYKQQVQTLPPRSLLGNPPQPPGFLAMADQLLPILYNPYPQFNGWHSNNPAPVDVSMAWDQFPSSVIGHDAFMSQKMFNPVPANANQALSLPYKRTPTQFARECKNASAKEKSPLISKLPVAAINFRETTEYMSPLKTPPLPETITKESVISEKIAEVAETTACENSPKITDPTPVANGLIRVGTVQAMPINSEDQYSTPPAAEVADDFAPSAPADSGSSTTVANSAISPDTSAISTVEISIDFPALCASPSPPPEIPDFFPLSSPTVSRRPSIKERLGAPPSRTPAFQRLGDYTTGGMDGLIPDSIFAPASDSGLMDEILKDLSDIVATPEVKPSPESIESGKTECTKNPNIATYIQQASAEQSSPNESSSPPGSVVPDKTRWPIVLSIFKDPWNRSLYPEPRLLPNPFKLDDSREVRIHNLPHGYDIKDVISWASNAPAVQCLGGFKVSATSAVLLFKTTMMRDDFLKFSKTYPFKGRIVLAELPVIEIN